MELKAGMIKESYAKYICTFYGLPKPWIYSSEEDQECWLTLNTKDSKFPFKENRTPKGEIIINLWLVAKLLEMDPNFFPF